MKKLLVVLLAVAMIFAFGATAMAADTEIPDYSDLSSMTEAGQIATMRLTALGVLDGQNGWGGTILGKNNITRAELSKVALYLTNNEDAYALYATLPSQFSDVADGYWAEGYINACLDFGLMKGVGGGLFNPNGTVSYQEAATVILRALGYDDNLPGDWPYEYNTKAVKIGLTKYTNYIAPAAITREDLFILCNNALDDFTVFYAGATRDSFYSLTCDADGYAYYDLRTNETGDIVSKAIDIARAAWHAYNGAGFGELIAEAKSMAPQSLLNKSFDAYCITDVLFAYDAPAAQSVFANWNKNELLEGMAWGYKGKLSKGELLLISDDKDLMTTSGKASDVAEVASNYYIWNADLWELAARYADVTIMQNDDDDYEVVFVEATSDIKYLDSFSDVNDDYDFAKTLPCAGIVGGAVDEDSYGYLYLNADGEIYYVDDVYAEGYDIMTFGVVDDIDDDMVIFEGALNDYDDMCRLGEDDCDSNKHDHNIAILRDGKLGTPADLEVGDVVYYAGVLDSDPANAKVSLYIAIPAEDTVFEDIDDNKGETNVTLDGKEYNYSSASDGSLYRDKGGNYNQMIYANVDAEDYYDDECQYAMAYAPDQVAILYFDKNNDTKYGVITDFNEYYVTSGDWKSKTVTIYTPDGKKDFTWADKQTVIPGVAGNVLSGAAMDGIQNAAGFTFCVGDLIEFELNADGEIEEITQAAVFADNNWSVRDGDLGMWNFSGSTDEDGTLSDIIDAPVVDFTGTDYTDSCDSATGLKHGYITEDTEIFMIAVDGGDFDGVSMGKAADFIDADIDAQQIVYFYTGKDNKEITVLYVVDGAAGGGANYGVAIKSRTNSKGDYLTFSSRDDIDPLYFSDAALLPINSSDLPLFVYYHKNGAGKVVDIYPAYDDTVVPSWTYGDAGDEGTFGAGEIYGLIDSTGALWTDAGLVTVFGDINGDTDEALGGNGEAETPLVYGSKSGDWVTFKGADGNDYEAKITGNTLFYDMTNDGATFSFAKHDTGESYVVIKDGNGKALFIFRY